MVLPSTVDSFSLCRCIKDFNHELECLNDGQWGSIISWAFSRKACSDTGLFSDCCCRIQSLSSQSTSRGYFSGLPAPGAFFLFGAPFFFTWLFHSLYWSKSIFIQWRIVSSGMPNLNTVWLTPSTRAWLAMYSFSSMEYCFLFGLSGVDVAEEESSRTEVEISAPCYSRNTCVYELIYLL